MGAVGVVQVLPSTAKDKAVDMYGIEKLESNLHAGVKYFRWVIDAFCDEPGITLINRWLVALASHNAGPSGRWHPGAPVA